MNGLAARLQSSAPMGVARRRSPADGKPRIPDRRRTHAEGLGPRFVYSIHSQEDPGWPWAAVGAEMGAAIRRQLRSDAVRHRDRGLT